MGTFTEIRSKLENRQAAQAKIDALLTPSMMRALRMDATQKPAMVDQFTSDWLRDMFDYDAKSTLGALTIPILALNGSLDRQIPSKSNLAGIRLATAKNPDVTVLELAGLNHKFQTARSGTIAEYAEIEETFEPNAMRTIGKWINTRFNRKIQSGG